MLLLDSLFINNSGGKILLDYLVKELEESGIDVFYLFDLRCINDYQWLPEERKMYLKASLISRHKFYIKNKDRFSKVLCFGNLAPTMGLSIPVYVYFHQRLFLSIPKTFSKKQRLIFLIKRFIFRKLLNNTDALLLQTNSIKEELLKTIAFFKESKVKVLPFYEALEYPQEKRIKYRIIYVSGGAAHKNHLRLLNAFERVYDKTQKGELVLTVSDEFISIKQRINTLIKRGYPIVNLGFISKDELGKEYAKAEFSVFPSLSESFGLGIIEALEGGCKILGADLPYMYAVCKPSLTFNPYSEEDIADCLELAMTKTIKESEQIIKNNINGIIELLK